MTILNNREESFFFHPFLCLLLQILMNPESLLTPGFYKLLYVCTAAESLTQFTSQMLFIDMCMSRLVPLEGDFTCVGEGLGKRCA